MEEKQALLFKERNPSGNHQKTRLYSHNDDNTSSDDSDEWWEGDSQSECSSCCETHSRSSFEWESEIKENGELFYIESHLIDTLEPNFTHDCNEPERIHGEEKINKEKNLKKGRLLNWVRRRDSKKLQSKPLEILKNDDHPVTHGTNTDKIIKNNERKSQLVVLKIESIGQGETLSEKLFGFLLGVSNPHQVIITHIIPGSPAEKSKYFKIGDILCKINNNIVKSKNVESILELLNLPCEVSVEIQRTEQCSSSENSKFQSSFVLGMLNKNEALDNILMNQPVGVVVVDIESQNLNKDDIIYSYPEKSVLSSSRGAFVTLFHLLAEIKPNDICQSSSVTIKKQLAHVLYKSEENFLLLIAIPQARCTLKEATYILHDLIRNLLFTKQTLKKCFETNDKSELDHFFSLFFIRLLSNGFSSNSFRFTTLEDGPRLTFEPASPQFEDIMPYANWVPLPKEAQIQIDEALNELEANDFENEGEENIENQRTYNIVGSCLFYKGYLLASHLPKDDLLDVYSFYRQNCLIQLLRNEPVKSLIIWKEVFPLSVNRGLPCKKSANYTVPSGRWFMLTIGQGYDSLTIILEAGENCIKAERHPGPAVPYVEEAEDTLRHMQKLGIFNLASQWIESNSRFKTVTPEEIISKKSNSKKENLLGFVKTFDGTSKLPVPKASPISSKSDDSTAARKVLGTHPETSEDSVSQTPSNVSEVSDENAPILGRRAERSRILSENMSGDSDSSDSDWDSSRDSNMRESTCSSGIDNFYLCDIGEVLPARLTSGPNDILFHYVHMDGNEGILMNPPLNAKRSTPKMNEILRNFRRCAQIIHSILENNIRFKKNTQDGSKCFINKSLVAVKEHGVNFECAPSDSDPGKKPAPLAYWIIGRLFFAPQPREIYVCFYEDAPQNLVEIAFRLGLSVAG